MDPNRIRSDVGPKRFFKGTLKGNRPPRLPRKRLSITKLKTRPSKVSSAAQSSRGTTVSSDSDADSAHHRQSFDDEEERLHTGQKAAATELLLPDFSDENTIYQSLLKTHNAIAPVNDYGTAYIIQHMRNNKLQDIYFIVQRRLVKCPSESVWVFSCSCDLTRSTLVTGLSDELDENPDRALPDSCIHIDASQHILGNFDEGSHKSPQESFEDHGYSKKKPKVYGIPSNPLVVCATIPKAATVSYGIVKVDVKEKKHQLKCSSYDCRLSQYDCEHTNEVLAKIIEGENEALNKLKETLGKKVSERDRYVPCAYSKRPIPFFLQPEEQKRSRGFQYPSDTCIVPDNAGDCECGSPWADEDDPVTQNWMECEPYLFTLTDMLRVKVYYRKCSSETCTEKKYVDGSDQQLLYMGGYLVHHNVFRAYMHQYLTEGTTMSAFYKEWHWTQLESGHTDFMDHLSYYRFTHAWYSFLGLLDVDYAWGFSCPECGDVPDAVNMDGVTLGVQKSFLPWKNFTKGEQEEVFDGSSRVFINSLATRTLLQKYVESVLSTEMHKQLIAGLKQYRPSLIPLMNEIENGTTIKKADIKRFLVCLSKSSPICALIHFDDHLFSLIEKITGGYNIHQNASDSLYLQQHVPLLAQVLKIDSQHVHLLYPVLTDLVTISKKPYQRNSPHSICMCNDCTCANQDLGYFPALPQVAHRGVYVLDSGKYKGEEKKEKCSKRASKHSSLTPGLFTMSCTHGVCYGFQLMHDEESPDVPFTLLRTRFKRAPKYVVYDNGCNLHAYCLNRDPVFFRHCWFLVERFHWKNHVGCHEGYNIGRYPELNYINSQVSEQRNATLKKLRSMLSYMNVSNFKLHCKLFMWFRSMVSISASFPMHNIPDKEMWKKLTKLYSSR